MAIRLSNKQKEAIKVEFLDGKTIEELAQQFKCNKLTIKRNLIKIIGQEEFKSQSIKNKSFSEPLGIKENPSNEFNVENNKEINVIDFPQNKDTFEKEYFNISQDFVEISPLSYEFNNEVQKDFSSVPLSEINLPKIVFMVVDKKIELEIKYLRDYPDWQFLSKDDLNRKTIEIYIDLKSAKNFCSKEQKVLKIPNSDVFAIASNFLISKGISRIVFSDKLIAI